MTESEFEGGLTFEVKTEDGKWLDEDGNVSETAVQLTLKDGGFIKGTDGKYTKTFYSVATGKYTVTETNSDVEGYALVIDKSTTEGEATVEDGKEATIELKDVYEKQTAPEEKGDLIIRKTVGGDVTEEELEKAALKFEVKTADGK